MKLKLDENLGTAMANLFSQAGHDVKTVPEQNLCAASDKDLIAICHREQRCFVSLDLDFGNVLLFNPQEYSGIAILRLPSKASANHLLESAETLMRGLARESIERKLWIVEPGRIREYLPEEND